MSALEFFTGFITVFDNPVWDLVAGVILLSVAGTIAYKIGSRLGYRGKIGWYLWLITAIAVYALIACMIRTVMWLIALPWWVWAIVAVFAAAIVAVLIIIKIRTGDKHET